MSGEPHFFVDFKPMPARWTKHTTFFPLFFNRPRHIESFDHEISFQNGAAFDHEISFQNVSTRTSAIVQQPWPYTPLCDTPHTRLPLARSKDDDDFQNNMLNYSEKPVQGLGFIFIMSIKGILAVLFSTSWSAALAVGNHVPGMLSVPIVQVCSPLRTR